MKRRNTITILSENMASKKKQIRSLSSFYYFISSLYHSSTVFFSMPIYYICAYFLCHFFRSSQINGHFLYENEANPTLLYFYNLSYFYELIWILCTQEHHKTSQNLTKTNFRRKLQMNKSKSDKRFTMKSGTHSKISR